MNAIIYTRSDVEYESFKKIIEKKNPNIDIERAPLDGHKYYHRSYDLVVVALEGAEGMEVVKEYSERYSDSQIIWITADEYFAAMAMRLHIYDFIKSPYDLERVEDSFKQALKVNPGRNQWKL